MILNQQAFYSERSFMKTAFLLIFILFVSHIIIFAENNAKISTKAKQIMENHIMKIKGIGEADHVYKNGNNEIIVYTATGPCFNDKSARPGGCGNNYLTYMLAIIDGKIFLPIQVGGKGYADISAVDFKNNTILLDASTYQVNDPMCCPSGSSVIEYKIQNSKLVKFNQSSKTVQYSIFPDDVQLVNQNRKIYNQYETTEIARIISSELAKNLPQQINRYMTFYSVYYFGNEIFLKMSFDEKQFEDPTILQSPDFRESLTNLAKPIFKQNVCTNADIFAALEKGVVLKYKYSFSHDSNELTFTVSIEDCR